jgi:hypothetical protein
LILEPKSKPKPFKNQIQNHVHNYILCVNTKPKPRFIRRKKVFFTNKFSTACCSWVHFNFIIIFILKNSMWMVRPTKYIKLSIKIIHVQCWPSSRIDLQNIFYSKKSQLRCNQDLEYVMMACHIMNMWLCGYNINQPFDDFGESYLRMDEKWKIHLKLDFKKNRYWWQLLVAKSNFF